MDMKYAINVNTILPIMCMPDEDSAMASQMLFGEYCTVIGNKDNWCKVQNCLDNHIGWVERETLQALTLDEFQEIKNNPLIRVCVPIADVFCLTDKTVYRFSMGSVIPNYNEATNKFAIGDVVYQVHSSLISYLPSTNREGIVPTVMSLLNTPYLRAGKNVLGMDSIGFIQTVFAVNGFLLAGTIPQLRRQGEAIEGLENAEAGDLLFFNTRNSSSIHIGIYIGDNKVAHLAKKVRINIIGSDGGMLTGYDKFTYDLIEVRRMS